MAAVAERVVPHPSAQMSELERATAPNWYSEGEFLSTGTWSECSGTDGLRYQSHFKWLANNQSGKKRSVLNACIYSRKL